MLGRVIDDPAESGHVVACHFGGAGGKPIRCRKRQQRLHRGLKKIAAPHRQVIALLVQIQKIKPELMRNRGDGKPGIGLALQHRESEVGFAHRRMVKNLKVGHGQTRLRQQVLQQYLGAGFGLALGTRRLALRVGADAARDLVATGRRIELDEAAGLGLVTRTPGADAVEAELESLAATLAIDRETVARINTLTVPDTRAADMANLVASAARPGLKTRITAYVAALQARKAGGGNR